jgi:branched-subunit amino acid transport protein
MKMRWEPPDWLTGKLEFVPVILVGAVTAASLCLGFAYRPTVSAPPTVPNTPNLTIDFSSQSPQSLDVDIVLTGNAKGQAQLKIDAAGTFGAGQQTVGYDLYVGGFTGSDCTPKSDGVTLVDLGGGDYSAMRTVPISANGDPFLIVDLCWTSQSPLTVNSSYLSAALPPVIAAYQTGTLTRTVNLSDNGLAGYQLAGAIPPTSQGPPGWSWLYSLDTSPGAPAANPLLVSGTSIVGVQQASDDTFYSGVAFGVGFGGVIALLLAVPDVWRQFQERRKAKSAAEAKHSVEAGESVEATQAT